MVQSRMLKKSFPYLFLLIVALIAMWPLWLNPHAMPFDMADYFLPNRFFLAECLRNRIFPWWNPYSGLGIPFYADPQSGAFYPFTWIIGLVFGYDFFSINLEYILHLVIGGWGLYRLMHSMTKSVTASLCMATCYELCGVFIGNAQHLTWIISAAWMPWIIFFWKKIFENGNFTHAIALAFCLMLITTGGYPAFIIILIYVFLAAMIAYLIYYYRLRDRSRIARMLKLHVIFGIGFLLICAPFIVSFLEALPYFTRAAAINENSPGVLVFSPPAIISLLFPSATLSHIDFYRSDASMLNGYFGLLPVIFLIVMIITKQSLKSWMLLLVSALFLLVSFGNNFFLWKILVNILPLMNHIRFPASFRLFAIIGFLISAGLVMNNDVTYKRIIPATILLLMALIASAVYAYSDEHRILLPAQLSIEGLQSFYNSSTITNNILVQSFIQVSIVIVFLIAFILREGISQRKFHVVLLAATAIDLVLASWGNEPITVVSKYKTNLLDQKLSGEPKDFPVSLQKNISEVTHEGDGSFAPSYYNNNIFEKQIAFNSYNPFDLKSKDSLDHFAKKNFLLSHPLCYISNDVVEYSGKASDSSVKIQNGVVLLDADVAELPAITGHDSLVSDLMIEKFSPLKVSLKTNTNEKAVLTMLQNFYPGWKATIDGKATKILKSNFSMMSIVLPSGDHEVLFQYQERFIQLLLEISVTAQLLLAALLLLKKNKKKIPFLPEVFQKV